MSRNQNAGNRLVVVRGILGRAAAKLGLGSYAPSNPLARIVKASDMDAIAIKASELGREANSHRATNVKKEPARDRAWCSKAAESAAYTYFNAHGPKTANKKVVKHVRGAGLHISNEAVARIRRELGFPSAKVGRKLGRRRRVSPSPEAVVQSNTAADHVSLEAMLPRLSTDMLRLCVQEWNRRVTAALDLATDPLAPLPEATAKD